MTTTSSLTMRRSKYQYTGKGTVTEIYIDDADTTGRDCGRDQLLPGPGLQGEERRRRRRMSPCSALSDRAQESGRPRLSTPPAIEEDDYVVFTVDYNEDEDFYICELMAPETVTGEVTRVDKDTGRRDRRGRDRRDLSEAGRRHQVHLLRRRTTSSMIWTTTTRKPTPL